MITPREGCKLVVRSSKANGQEDYFVDAVEVVSFGHSFFFRSSEKPKSFLVPCSDYEILELRETRMVLKHVPTERSVKIGGGRDSAPPRQPRESQADKSESKQETKYEPRQEREAVPAESDEEAPVLAEGATAPTEPKSDRNKRDRRRRGRRGRTDRGTETTSGPTDGSEPVTDDSQEPVSESSSEAPVDQKKIFEKPLVPISKRVLLAPPPFKTIMVPPAIHPELVMNAEMNLESPHVPASEAPSEYPSESKLSSVASEEVLEEEDDFPESLKEPKQED